MTTAAAHTLSPETLSPRSDRDRVDRELTTHLADARRRFAANPHVRPLYDRAAAFVLHGGKRIRPRLCLASYRIAAACEPSRSTWCIAASTELFHAFMLVHDDLIDGSTLRRDQLALHEAIRLDLDDADAPTASKHAADLGLVAGDLLAALGHRLVARSGAPASRLIAVQRLVADMLVDTGLGEALDILYDNAPLDHLTERQILDAYLLKTSRYSVSGPLMLGALLAGSPPAVVRALARFGDRLGLAYQLQNDLDALALDPTLGGDHPDLDRGKRTWVLWKAHRRLDPEGRDALRNALLDPVGPARRIRLWRLIHASGAIEAGRQRLQTWRDQAINAIDDAPLAPTQRHAYLALIGLLPGASSLPAEVAEKATA